MISRNRQAGSKKTSLAFANDAAVKQDMDEDWCGTDLENLILGSAEKGMNIQGETEWCVKGTPQICLSHVTDHQPLLSS